LHNPILLTVGAYIIVLALPRRCKLPIVHRSKKESMDSIDRELFEASKENNVSEVSRLLSVGADVNAKDHCGYTPLHKACSKGRLQAVIELLEYGADIDATNNAAWTALHCACYNGHVAVGNELLSRGANIEAKSNQGNTPLHYAAMEGHLSVVKALRAVGANLLAVNNFGLLPIHCAVSRGHSAVAKCLLQHSYATTLHLPLHQLLKDLTWFGDLDISGGVPPLRAALHRYVLRMDDVVEIVEFLVDRTPELIGSRDQDGSLPLHVACRCGAPFTIVQSLVDRYKASVKSVTCQGDLPLFLACDIADPSLDTIFLLMKMYPDLVYR
jgi:ankyrin repeat protein